MSAAPLDPAPGVAAAVTTLRVHPPVVRGRIVELSWSTTPRSNLYRSERAVLRFPDEVDPGAVPDGFWPRAAVLLLHTHAAVLAPCRMIIPGDPGAPALQVLRDHIARIRDTVEWYAGRGFSDLPVEVEADHGVGHHRARHPPSGVSSAVSSRVVGLVSGGRDGFVQADLLREATDGLVLASVTAPMPPSSDHLNRFRRIALDAVPSSFGVPLVEVDTDLRGVVDNEWARERGRAVVGIHELSDQVLFAVVGAAVAAATLGAEAHLAAETEAHIAMELDGRPILPHQPTSSAVTLAVLDAWFAPVGVRVRSGIGGLRSRQVSRLLTRRRPDLAGLVQTCWRADVEERACSACAQCLTRTLALLAEGMPAVKSGVDLDTLAAWSASWDPAQRSDPRWSPRQAVSRMVSGAAVRDARALGDGSAGATLDARHRRWLAELADRFPDLGRWPHDGWCRDLLGIAGPILGPVVDEVATSAFGAGDADRGLVAVTMELLDMIRSVAPGATG
jgi:hypothetical protein